MLKNKRGQETHELIKQKTVIINLEWKEAENLIILPPVAEKADHGSGKPPPRLNRVLAAMLTVFFLGINIFLICMHCISHK